MDKVISAVAASGYKATDAQVSAIARNVATGRKADGTYLRVLVVSTLAGIGAGRGAVMKAFKGAHAHLYELVREAVGHGVSDPIERNRRATFARTAASTLKAFIKAGGDLKGLDITTVTKTSLRRAVGPPQPTGTRRQVAAVRARDALLRVARGMTPVDARAYLLGVQEAAQNALDAITLPRAAKAAPSVRVHHSARRGAANGLGRGRDVSASVAG